MALSQGGAREGLFVGKVEMRAVLDLANDPGYRLTLPAG
jgi:hypothetical protein